MILREQLQKLLEQRTGIFDTMSFMLDWADAEQRDLTEDETAEYTKLEEDYKKVDTEVKRVEDQVQREDELNRVTRIIHSGDIVVDPQKLEAEFRNFGEFLYACAFNQSDHRLAQRATQNMSEGTAGGFAVPNQFLPGLKEVTPQEAIVRPRATIIPAGTPPDSEVTFPALDQRSGENMYGGVEVTWIKEGKTKPATNFKLREVTLTPHEVAATLVLTDKLIRNWPAASSTAERLLRSAMIGAEDDAFLNGDGVAKPHGLIHSGCLISVARATANLIAFADVVNVYVRLLRRGGSPAWVYSQAALPQLINMVDPGSAGTLIWQPSARDGEPDRLLGIPAFISERSATLGSLGDLLLVDLNYYLIKDGSGPFVAASPHVYFEENKTVIKIFWNVDGDTWLNEPLPLEGDSTTTVSPIVALAE